MLLFNALTQEIDHMYVVQDTVTRTFLYEQNLNFTPFQ